MAERDPGGHLHQQGGARDEDPRRPDGGADCRGNAVAWNLSFDRGENPAAARRAGRAQARLHHPRRRRSDPPAQATAGSREHRREALAGARARRPARQLEEPRLDARAGSGRRGRELRGRQGQEALRCVSGPAEGAQRRRLRRPAAGMHPAVPRAARGAAAVPGALQVHPGGRVPGHQRRAVSVAAAAGAEHERAAPSPRRLLGRR